MTENERTDAIEACEQRLVNLWPAVDTLLVGDWVVRFARGYSGRANSASALRRNTMLADADLALIEQLYRNAGLPPAIRVSPLADPALEGRLAARGWQVRTRAIGMIADLDPAWAGDDRAVIEPQPSPQWLGGICRLQAQNGDAAKANPDHLAAIVGRIRLPAGFATLLRDGLPVGFGMAAVDRGWGEIGAIILAPEARGAGLGRALVKALLAHAATLGAQRLFLQVDASNTVALALYRSLGFAELYAYREWRCPCP